jgi:hypothetical protein
MPALKMTHLCVGLIVSAVGLALCLPSTANAGRVNKKQGPHYSQRAASTTKARQVNGRESNSVYWGCCTKMGADPDPFIRSQILRDERLLRRNRLAAPSLGWRVDVVAFLIGG